MGIRCAKLCDGTLLPDCGMRESPDARCAAPQAVVGPVRYSCKKCDCVRASGVRSSVFRSGFYLGLKVRTLERLLRALDNPRSAILKTAKTTMRRRWQQPVVIPTPHPKPNPPAGRLSAHLIINYNQTMRPRREASGQGAAVMSGIWHREAALGIKSCRMLLLLLEAIDHRLDKASFHFVTALCCLCRDKQPVSCLHQ